jgi:hypothetical protein
MSGDFPFMFMSLTCPEHCRRVEAFLRFFNKIERYSETLGIT